MDPATTDSINSYEYVTNWDESPTPLHPLYQSDAAADPLVFPLQVQPEAASASATATSVVSDPSPALEDIDFSETVKFISQVLMEENVEQRPFYDPISLQLTENSFYDALTDTILLSPSQHPLDLDLHSPTCSTGATSSSSTSSNNSADSRESKPPSPDAPVSVSVSVSACQFTSHAISSPPSLPLPNASNTNSNTNTNSDGTFNLDSCITNLLAQNICSDADSVAQFRRGLEEASKFLPPRPQLCGLQEVAKFHPSGPQLVVTCLETTTVAVEENSNSNTNSNALKSRKNHERDGNGSDDTEEGRSTKQSAVSGLVDETESHLSDMFDRVLLNVGPMPMCNEQTSLHNGPLEAAQPAEGEGRKPRSKRQGKKKETVDLRTLLVLCAQAVSGNDNTTANELLKQIRQHSSPFGDASQRLAHYFANGLEARLVGDGSARGFCTSKRVAAAEYLQAYQLYLSTCPFKMFALFLANKMIMKAAIKAETLHIIDFGILYGFQWPVLIKFLSEREGGPPKLKITGIDFPQPGFRPAERVEETGRRLANYCERFRVPFEYNAIATRNWEALQVEDLKIQSNELLAVNCFMRFKNLLDETFEVNSPRNAVLHLIRKINPDIFVHSIVNGSYNSPFFATRFREALFHFSAIYDMVDTVMPRKNEKRMMAERDIAGREAVNVIACEGFERVERPETYKQWQARVTKAGFKQLPLNEELMAKFRDKLRAWYHKDFVFDEDNNWMLQGWKGRILFASTCWVPA